MTLPDKDVCSRTVTDLTLLGIVIGTLLCINDTNGFLCYTGVFRATLTFAVQRYSPSFRIDFWNAFLISPIMI